MNEELLQKINKDTAKEINDSQEYDLYFDICEALSKLPALTLPQLQFMFSPYNWRYLRYEQRQQK